MKFITLRVNLVSAALLISILGVGASAGDFRTKASGDWNTPGTWEVYNGIGWVGAGTPPLVQTAAEITILSGDSINQSALYITVSPANNVIVQGELVIGNNTSFSTLDLNAGGLITINSGSDLTIASTVTLSGTLTSFGGFIPESTQTINNSAVLTFKSGSEFQVNSNTVSVPKGAGGGSEPTVTYESGSTISITGATTATTVTGLNQSVHHLTFNSTGQTSSLELPDGLLVAGDLTISSTGTGEVVLPAGESASVTGAVSISGGVLRNKAAAALSLGSLSVTGGTYIHSGNGVNNKAIPTATWATASTLSIEQLTTDTVVNGFGQSFGNVTINSTGLTDKLRLNGTSAITAKGKFKLENTNAKDVYINQDLNAQDSFVFSSSATFDIGSNSLEMEEAAEFGGYTSDKYVKLNSSGSVCKKNLGNSEKHFPVGNGSYNPVKMTNAGTVDVFCVTICNMINTTGTCSGGTPYTQGWVNRTWQITELLAGGSDVTLKLYWSAGDEMATNFDTASCLLNHYNSTGSVWENLTTATSASTSGSLYYLTATEVDDFSPFGVGGSGTALPITLVNFEVDLFNTKDVQISWATASEENHSHFEVERGIMKNGTIDFKSIKTIQSNHNSASLMEYGMVDTDPAEAEITYYRLKSVDMSGHVDLSQIESVKRDVNSIAVNIYPNPARFNLTVSSESLTTGGTWSILNSEGRRVEGMHGKAMDNTMHINVSDWSKGIYFLVLTDADGKLTHEKFMIK